MLESSAKRRKISEDIKVKEMIDNNRIEDLKNHLIQNYESVTLEEKVELIVAAKANPSIRTVLLELLIEKGIDLLEPQLTQRILFDYVQSSKKYSILRSYFGENFYSQLDLNIWDLDGVEITDSTHEEEKEFIEGFKEYFSRPENQPDYLLPIRPKNDDDENSLAMRTYLSFFDHNNDDEYLSKNALKFIKSILQKSIEKGKLPYLYHSGTSLTMNLFEHAVCQSMHDFVSYLLSLGFNPNISLDDGCTALERAIENKDFKMVEILLNAGINPNLISREDYDFPVQSAVENKSYDIASLLISFGSTPCVRCIYDSVEDVSNSYNRFVQELATTTMSSPATFIVKEITEPYNSRCTVSFDKDQQEKLIDQARKYISNLKVKTEASQASSSSLSI